MDLLPVELFDAICELVGSEDIASLRLVSRSICHIATPFLTSKIHLIFKPGSFSRMGDISKHPIISKQITSILYEPNVLSAMDRETWESHLISGEYKAGFPMWEAEEGTTAYRMRFMESFHHQPRHSHTKEQLEKGWAIYQHHYSEQQGLIRQQYGTSDLVNAMSRLPNVTELRMSMSTNLTKRSGYLTFQDKLYGAFGGDGIPHAPGVPQLISLLQSMYKSRIKLQVFECGVSWKIFQCSMSDLRVFAEILAPVRKLKILLTAYNYAGDIIRAELPEYRSFSEKGRVRDLLFQANTIEDLEVKFVPAVLINLFNLVGAHVWPKLTSITLSTIETTEEELLGSLVRHKSTLRRLHLNTVFLHQGNWLSLVPQMRSSLDLEECVLDGRLLSDNPRQDFWLAPYYKGDSEGACKLERRAALRDWFLTGGECPLTAAWSVAHPWS